jgi:hypothetical protein
MTAGVALMTDPTTTDQPRPARRWDQPRGTLWQAVDRITKPRPIRLERDWTDPEISRHVRHLEHQAHAIAAGRIGPGATRTRACDVRAYRRAVITANAELDAYTRSHGTTESLWEACENLLHGSRGSQGGSGGKGIARERSITDMALLETMADIRETVGNNLTGRRLTRRPTVPAQLRQLAAWIDAHEPDTVDFWTYRIEQWARLLQHYLQAATVQPKPVRIRGQACPACGAKTTVVEQEDGSRTVEPALVIDFAANGMIRAAECQACGTVTWRGAMIHDNREAVTRFEHADGEHDDHVTLWRCPDCRDRKTR